MGYLFNTDTQYYNGFGGTPNYRQIKSIDAYETVKKYLDD